jgi:hypothetical protein
MASSSDSAPSSFSESTFFIEYSLVTDLISLLPTTDSPTFDSTHDNDAALLQSQESTKIANGNQALTKLKQIFDKYLECPTLLDSKLQSIFQTLSCHAIDIIHDLHLNYRHLLVIDEEEAEEGVVIDEYPTTTVTTTATTTANDTSNNDLSSEDGDKIDHEKEAYYLKMLQLKRYLSTIYTICKVRGYKHVSKYLAHETKDVEPVLHVLTHFKSVHQQQNNIEKPEKDNEEMKRIMNKICSNPNEMEVAQQWESIYVLVLWIGMLSLVPFDLNTIDSTMTHDQDVNSNHDDYSNTHNKNKPTTLISSMIYTTQQHLYDAGPTRIIAASSLAKLFSRPDLEQEELQWFVHFSNETISSFLLSLNGGVGNQTTTAASTIFLVMGIVQTLANIFKSGHRFTLMTKRHLSLIETLWENAIVLSERCSSSSTNSSTNSSSSSSVLLRKLLVKLFARVGCSYLPPRIATWRYQRGKRSLLENLVPSNNNTTATTATTAATNTTTLTMPDINSSISKSKQNRSYTSNEIKNDDSENIKHADGNDDDDDDDDELFHVPDQVEDSMAQLIQALTDPATIVRWSAAKGIGRLTERLPILCADDVLDTILELCINEQNYENDNIWHGSCLTLAELARRGLLLPERLEEVIPIVIQAIQYDVPRGSHSVGSHVRDAACYVCWAFARAYAPNILKPFVQELSVAIVIASLFDREINCRRAASASFQECVGRQGADNFKHGIVILTSADYFTIGNRAESFTNVAKKIAAFDEYRHPLIRHVYEEKLFHWDVDIRNLSSKSLRILTSLEPQYFAEIVLSNLLPLCTSGTLFIRHGAILGVAEVTLALGREFASMESKANDDSGQQSYHDFSDDIKNDLSEIVFQIEKARLYRGRGGEIMRSAVSRFIECLSISKIPLTVKKQVELLDSLDVNFKHPNEEIQKRAAATLSALMDTYFPVGSNGPSERLQNRVVNNYIKMVKEEENPAATRGFALALGSLPPKLIACNQQVLTEVIDCLSFASNDKSKVGQQGDAETRRNAIESLVRICETVGIGEGIQFCNHGECPVVGLNQEQCEKVFESLLSCINDYNTDRRGDVGSWCRIAAMKGLVSVTLLAVKSSNIPQNENDVNESIDNKVPSNRDDMNRVPLFQQRVDTSFENDIDDRIKYCLQNNEPYRNWKQTSALTGIYFDDILCARVLGAILKQLSEKLDSIRQQAGLCLERLLLGKNIVPFIPCKEMLLEGLDLLQMYPNKNHDDNNPQMNWSKPELTFPLLMRVVNIDKFRQPIIAGIVISVGGLTESVTKHSQKSFLDYLRALQKAKMFGRISKIGKGM